MSQKDHYNEYTKMEISSIDTELKDWFLTRRVNMERNLSIKKALDESNFSGLTHYAPGIPTNEKVLWRDLTQGKPKLEESLSANARKMKADMYLTMFRNATDLDHVCRIPGSAFLRCMKDHAAGAESDVESNCSAAFSAFNVCRKGVIARQDESMRQSALKQDIGDQRAKALFERRNILLDTLAC